MYECDFHCAWLHDIRIEKVVVDTERQQLPVCIAGVGGCPPEDSGPADRFMEGLKDHSGEDFVEWVEDLLEKPELDRSALCEGLDAWRPWIDRHFDRKAGHHEVVYRSVFGKLTLVDVQPRVLQCGLLNIVQVYDT